MLKVPSEHDLCGGPALFGCYLPHYGVRQRLPLPERGPGLGQDPMLFVEAQQVILWELGVKLNLVHCRDYTRLVNELL
jgi:hypothetical protein